MILETERLILRPWQESDAADLFRYASHPDVGPITGWLPHTSVDDSRDTIKNVLSLPETYALFLKSVGHVVGSAGLMAVKQENGEPSTTEIELGYWIGVPYWGQGLVPEAARELIRHAFEDLGYTKILAGYYDGNSKSKRVLEKCGFSYDRTEQNVFCSPMDEYRTSHIMYLAKEDWLSKQ